MTNPKVSISCVTYNHENYIRDCLESILMQKTDFDFEILVHDDASTDKTTTILKEYESKFPGIVKPLYQTENQYSKGIPIQVTYNLPRVNGNYVAVCDGDDYWIDPLKLQKQFDHMEANKNCNLVVTNYKNFYEQENKFRNKILKKDLNANAWDNCTKLATCTLFFRSDVVRDDAFIAEMKRFKMIDLPLQYYLLLTGGLHILPDITAVYRRGFGVYSSKDHLTRLLTELVVSNRCGELEKLIKKNWVNERRIETEKEFPKRIHKAVLSSLSKKPDVALFKHVKLKVIVKLLIYKILIMLKLKR